MEWILYFSKKECAQEMAAERMKDDKICKRRGIRESK